MNADCIFCKIIAGLLPSTKVYEDADVLAFMDIGPIVKGHTLVVPKKHFDPITSTPIEVLSKIMAVVQRVVAAQMKGLKADGVNVLQANGTAAGQQVPHIHFHVVPRFKTDGHHWNWNPKKYTDPEEMRKLAEAIKTAL
ncbi:MAG: HIT family protein [Lentisphaerota bacterium]